MFIKRTAKMQFICASKKLFANIFDKLLRECRILMISIQRKAQMNIMVAIGIGEKVKWTYRGQHIFLYFNSTYRLTVFSLAFDK